MHAVSFFQLKPNMLTEYTRTLQNEILPLLRKQRGFQEEITLSNPGNPNATAITLWDSKASAEAYNTDHYPEVLNTDKNNRWDAQGSDV